MLYQCRHFSVQELVDEITYNRYGNQCWQFLDDRLLKVIDHLRDQLGSITVNNWNIGGSYSQSGLRASTSTTGALMSSHKFGRAFDLKFKDHSAEWVRNWFKDNWTLAYIRFHFGITFSITIENKVSWVHIDIRNNEKVLNWINP